MSKFIKAQEATARDIGRVQYGSSTGLVRLKEL